MASNQEKFAKEIVDKAIKMQKDTVDLFNSINGLTDDFLKNMEGDEALKTSLMLKKSKAFEGFNNAKKEFDNLRGGK